MWLDSRRDPRFSQHLNVYPDYPHWFAVCTVWKDWAKQGALTLETDRIRCECHLLSWPDAKAQIPPGFPSVFRTVRNADWHFLSLVSAVKSAMMSNSLCRVPLTRKVLQSIAKSPKLIIHSHVWLNPFNTIMCIGWLNQQTPIAIIDIPQSRICISNL